MATKKDLVEAYSFSRRRLVTAFVSGAPGGREVEPSRPGRTIVGGFAVAILLVAGAAIAGAFDSDADVDWSKPGLVQSKEKGASYVVLEPYEDGRFQVRPVINVTSAQLILGADMTPEVVPESEIDEVEIGPDIGILGAPVTVPGTDDLIETGWTACTDTGRGIRGRVTPSPDVTPALDAGLVVRSGKTYYVIGQAEQDDNTSPRAYRYELPANLPNLDNMLGALGLPIIGSAKTVPSDWLNLFPQGGALNLRSFDITGLGDDFDQAGEGGVPSGAHVGDYYEIDETLFVLTAEGPAQFSDFARVVYLNSRLPESVKDLGLDAPPALRQAEPSYAAASWPTDILRAVPGEQCAQLLPSYGQLPGVQLVESPGEDAAAAEVDKGERDVTVDSGSGAFILSGGWDSAAVGEPYVIDGRGISYALLGTDAVENLGFGDYDAPVVPDSWLELFQEGEDLSVDAALCPPTRPLDDEDQDNRTCE